MRIHPPLNAMKRAILCFALLLAPLSTSVAQNSLLSGYGNLTSTTSQLPGFSASPLSWSILLPTSPTPAVFGPTFFNLSGVTAVLTQGATTLGVTGAFAAYTTGIGGGFFFGSAFFPFFATDGPQLFTGATSAPTFAAGTYPLTTWVGGFPPLITTREVVISNSVVPEPSTFALSAAGLVGLLAFARRRPRSVA